jgi:hypothetical protein
VSITFLISDALIAAAFENDQRGKNGESPHRGY